MAIDDQTYGTLLPRKLTACTIVLSLVLLYLFSTVVALQPIVKLDYASYRGVRLADGVTQWLGMRYTAAPVGDLRFAAPQDPATVRRIQAADKHGRICLATGDDPTNLLTSEDCLFIEVYAPSRASVKSRLPVYFFIHGGGFNSNANPNYNGRGLIAASDHEIVIVTFNYRLGPYGFLASRQIRESPTASLNNGLKDQRKALEWVQKYIHHFGGDPDHVVLGGDSAGAASIALHLTAFGGRNDGLFVGAAAESVSFATVLTPEESQYQYDTFVERLGCTSSPRDVHREDNTLACLRSKSAAELQTHNRNIPYPGARNPPLFMWNPVIDDDLIQNLSYAAFDSGSFIHVPVIFGDDTNGGTIFTPRTTSSSEQSSTFLHDQFPYLTNDHLRRIDDLYPNTGPRFPHSGSWWRQVSNAYGDIRYMCPTLFVSSALSRHGLQGNWNYRYNVEDPAQMDQGLGVPHTVELGAIWGPDNVHGAVPASYRAGESNAWIIPVMQGYWTSFIRALDPNVFRVEGSPLWEEFSTPTQDGGAEDKAQRRMLFDKSHTTRMEKVSTSTRARCRYFGEIGAAIRQ
ncbi:cholinesterase [Capronia coronata CBS 617.96]|uniref:Carboxylic ester hydrolase n=1 Tax=Capronia coronata CBS 617.96 TaxID=1182541 RepID=W9YYN7_9EURO|nr:cholinesterase [Capronia coronata CBS 617.96]EXJ94810.1 cholinesterase [Capronia coronata CBS 617.96]